MEDSKFKLVKAKNTPVSNEEILSDMRRVSNTLNTTKITQKIYGEHGQYDTSNIGRRFGTWNKALEAAGLSVSNQCNISDDVLFENLLILWQHYGRQPRRRELAFLPSTISQGPYNRRFGSWMAALESFVNFANETAIEPRTNHPIADTNHCKKSRDPSLRLRWHVLKRDRFVCCACGASPALSSGVELHVDHIIPWSKGGETIIENLQTLCAVCNLGKSNVHEETGDTPLVS